MTLSYEKIFSAARGLYTDPKELSLSADDLTEIYTERLNRVVGCLLYTSIRFRTLDIFLNSSCYSFKIQIRRY